MSTPIWPPMRLLMLDYRIVDELLARVKQERPDLLPAFEKPLEATKNERILLPVGFEAADGIWIQGVARELMARLGAKEA